MNIRKQERRHNALERAKLRREFLETHPDGFDEVRGKLNEIVHITADQVTRKLAALEEDISTLQRRLQGVR